MTGDVTSTISIGTVLPEPTQGVATDRSVAMEVAIRLGTAPGTQVVTGDVTDLIGIDISLPEPTNCEATGENVDMEPGTGLGTAPMTNIVTGDVASIGNKGLMQGGKIVAKPGSQDAPKSSQQKGTKVARLTQGLATGIMIGLDKNEVIMKNLNDVKSSAGSPKSTAFKNKKVTKKIALPEWLKKWQKIAAESPLH